MRINGSVNDDIFVADGHLTIRGEVNGDVLVVHGDALVTGRLDGDIVALDGRVTVLAGASVTWRREVATSTGCRAGHRAR